MATGTPFYFPAERAVDANGNPYSGALLYFYEAGTTTLLDTYSDADLAIAHVNANPVVADSGGLFGAIYLQPRSYKVILKTSGGSTIWTRDNVSAIPPLSALDNGVVNGRITAVSGAPFSSPPDGVGSSTIYFTPYRGNKIALYYQSAWQIYTFAEVSLALGTDAANFNYDLFAYWTGSAVALERMVWTNDTTRQATSLTTQDGVWVKDGDTTRRYLGTYRLGGLGSVRDETSQRWIWNLYNRYPRGVQRYESVDSWTYTTAAYRQAQGNTANQVSVVCGLTNESSVNIRLQALASNTAANVAVAVALSLNSLTTPPGGTIATVDSPAAGYRFILSAAVGQRLAAGYHYFAWLEYSVASGTTTWYGDGGAPTLVQSGIVGTYDC
jgi:hypothetical protein